MARSSRALPADQMPGGPGGPGSQPKPPLEPTGNGSGHASEADQAPPNGAEPDAEVAVPAETPPVSAPPAAGSTARPKPAPKPGSFQPGNKPGAKRGSQPGQSKPGASKPGASKPGAKPAVRQVAGKRPPVKAGAKKVPAGKGRKMSGGMVALASGTVIVVVVGIIVAIKLTSSPAARQSGVGVTTASANVVNAATNVPASVLEQAGLNPSSPYAHIQKVAGSPPLLTSNGKPELFFLGANFCPYCATQRWPMVVALSRFGTFSNLGQTSSSSTDSFPSTQTFSFYGSTYSSKYLSFAPVEAETNLPDGKGFYTTLQIPSKAQLNLVAKYDAPPYVASAQSAGGIPFQDFGNRFVLNGYQYDPQVLQGKSAATIAGSLAFPSSPIAQGANSSANWETAAICEMTNNQPASVCSLPVIKTAETDLAKLKAP
ncbi:MAG: DUF929 family protein [Acidimicrobiales bacterium]